MITLLLYFLQTSPDSRTPLWQQIARSGRVVEQGESESQRVSPKPALAPGPPPLLQFRYLEGKRRHRFGDTALVLDDAGH
ncbi:MAG: hypothetical protein M3Z09_15510 [Acidobacteriota bacterium]|nr:hypothetical protein [Acidobacteriota bacterium]